MTMRKSRRGGRKRSYSTRIRDEDGTVQSMGEGKRSSGWGKSMTAGKGEGGMEQWKLQSTFFAAAMGEDPTSCRAPTTPERLAPCQRSSASFSFESPYLAWTSSSLPSDVSVVGLVHALLDHPDLMQTIDAQLPAFTCTQLLPRRVRGDV